MYERLTFANKINRTLLRENSDRMIICKMEKNGIIKLSSFNIWGYWGNECSLDTFAVNILCTVLDKLWLIAWICA